MASKIRKILKGKNDKKGSEQFAKVNVDAPSLKCLDTLKGVMVVETIQSQNVVKTGNIIYPAEDKRSSCLSGQKDITLAKVQMSEPEDFTLKADGVKSLAQPLADERFDISNGRSNVNEKNDIKR